MATVAAILEIRTNLNPLVATIIETKYQFNPLIGSGEEVKNRFSRRPPWGTYWISNQHNLNKTEPTSPDQSHKVSVQSAVGRGDA